MSPVSSRLAFWLLAVVLSTYQLECTAYPQPSSIYGMHFKCRPCDPDACPMPQNCKGPIVKESGVCGCCLECAAAQGENCGLGKTRCAPGLECRPYLSGSGYEELKSIFTDKASCQPTTRGFSKSGKFGLRSRTRTLPVFPGPGRY